MAARIEAMSLKELFALREQLWVDPVAVSAELAAGMDGPAVETFMRGEMIIARNLTAGLIRRIEALESRVQALETEH